MTRPSTEEMFAWANNPPEHQLVGFATSEEELDDLKGEAIEGRRDFLYKAARHEIARRALTAAQEPEAEISNPEARFDFASLPLRRTITLRDCEVLAAIYQYHAVMRGERPAWEAGDAKRSWKDAAHTFAYMNGYPEDAPKFSDKFFKPSNPQYRGSESELEQIAEESFGWMLRRTTENERAGYTLRFLMDGVMRADESCLDVESLEHMLRKQRRRSPDSRYFGGRHLTFWEDLVRAKHEFDKKGPYRDKRTYADVVDELAPGVYTAPYMDATVVASKQFVSIDDWRRASLAVDNDMDLSRLARGFNTVVALASTGERYGPRRSYYSLQDPLNSHGATFFDRTLLSRALQSLQHGKAGTFIMPMIEHLISEGQHGEADDLDPDHLQIVFGTKSISCEVNDVLRSEI